MYKENFHYNKFKINLKQPVVPEEKKMIKVCVKQIINNEEDRRFDASQR